MRSSFDVGIVGCGVHGAATAFHLARLGASAVVVDRWGPAGGPTGRSSAVCRAYYTNQFLAEMARDSIAMLERFVEETGFDAEHRRAPLCYLHPPGDEADVRATAERLNAIGVPVEVLSPEEALEFLPGFDLSGIGIVGRDLHAGYADPHATTEGLVRRAVADGVQTRFGRVVTGLQPVTPAGGVLTLDDGEEVACGRVLLAAGPWTRPLAAQAGADLPLTVERHWVVTFRWAGIDPVPGHADIPGGYYTRIEGDDLCLTGPLTPEPQVDPDDFDDAVHPEEVERMAEAITRRIPRMELAEVHGGWASLYDVSPDWQPVIGPIAPGIFVDAGTSGHGFKLAPALGRQVAAMVLGEPTHEGLSEFDPSRFEQGRSISASYGDARILG